MKNGVISAVILSTIGLSGYVSAEEDMLQINGTMEVALTDNNLHTPVAELQFKRRINERVNAKILFLYEDEVTAIDSAAIQIGPQGDAWQLNIGYLSVPFGHFASHMASEPLTRILGETQENALEYRYRVSNLSSSIFLFNGVNDVNGNMSVLDNYGLNLTHASEFMTISFGYINDIGESNSLQEAITTQLGNNNTSDKVGGPSMALSFNLGAVSLNAERVSALKDFEAGQLAATALRPSTTNLELGYNFSMSGRKSTLAFGSQHSEDADVLGIPKGRSMVGLDMNLQDNTNLVLQYAKDTDYSNVVSSGIEAKLMVEF